VLGASFIVGSIALAGFPPFNGFISEWLTLQSVLGGIHIAATDPSHIPTNVLSVALLVGVLLFLATAFALTAFAFVKIAGEAFLGATRDRDVATRIDTADGAHKVTWLQQSIMASLAVACLLLGICAWPVMAWLWSIVSQTTPDLAIGSVRPDGLLGISIAFDRYSATLSQSVLVALGLVFLIAAPIAMIGRGGRKVDPWVFGTPLDTSLMQIRSKSYVATWSEIVERNSLIGARRSPSKRFITLFGRRSFAITLPGDAQARAPFRWIYATAIERLRVFTQWVGDVFHNGQLGRYLSYILLCFVTMLAVWFLWIATSRGVFG
jgi:NADH:ubiquinone oxidoreductase subunit 5 (subunit L)/multisubunit Na+/H+ antiporter MnhA subunit